MDPQASPEPIDSGHSLIGRARWVMSLLLLNVISFASVAAYGVTAKRHATRADLLTDNAYLASAGIAQITSLAAGVAFLVWVWRAYSHLPLLGATTQRLSTNWAIGVWFLPIATTLFGAGVPTIGLIIVAAGFIPALLLMADLERASDPTADQVRTPRWWKERPMSLLVVSWWLSWMIGHVADVVSQMFLQPKAGFKFRPGDSVSTLIRDLFNLPLNDHVWPALITYGVAMSLSAVLAMLLVRRITRLQHERLIRHGIQEPLLAAKSAQQTEPPASTVSEPPIAVINIPRRREDEEHSGQIEDGVETGLWIAVPRACTMIVEVRTIDQTALQLDVADETRSWIQVPPLTEPTYATALVVDAPSQRFLRVVDPTGGERAWTMRLWFEDPAS